MPLNPGQIALLVAAGMAGLVGLYFIWYLPRRPGHNGTGNTQYWGEHITLPSRLLIGLSALFLGYHLAVWAFPPAATNFQVPREWWWLVVGGVIGAIFATLALDRLSAADSAAGEDLDE